MRKHFALVFNKVELHFCLFSHDILFGIMGTDFNESINIHFGLFIIDFYIKIKR
jgi:hypothetical protein